MALFSRRPAATPAETPEGASDDTTSVDDTGVANAASDADPAASQPSAVADDEPDFDAVVGISMSSFQGLGAPAPAANAAAETAADDDAEAPPRPSVQDNGPLVTALARGRGLFDGRAVPVTVVPGDMDPAEIDALV